jgi:hypothetical protein
MKRSLFMRINLNLLVLRLLLLLLNSSLSNHLNNLLNNSSKVLLMVIMVVMDQITIATCISHNKVILNHLLLEDIAVILATTLIPLLNNLNNLNNLVTRMVKCLLNLVSMVINSSNLITCPINSNHKVIGSNSSSSNQVAYRDKHKINHLSLMISKEEV